MVFWTSLLFLMCQLDGYDAWEDLSCCREVGYWFVIGQCCSLLSFMVFHDQHYPFLWQSGWESAVSSWFIYTARHSCLAVSFFSHYEFCLGHMLSSSSYSWPTVACLLLGWWLVHILGVCCGVPSDPGPTDVLCLLCLPYIFPILFNLCQESIFNSVFMQNTA